MDNLELWLAVGFSLLVLAAAIGFVAFRQPVHAALSFAVTILAGSGWYLLLGAPYTAAATIIVYAGATIIIFLFALMFAQRSTLQAYDRKMANPLWAGLCAVTLSTMLLYVLKDVPASATRRTGDSTAITSSAITSTSPDASKDVIGTPTPRVADLGRVMYTQYLWAIELAGAILLVATIGAIHIASAQHSLESETEGAA